MTLQSQPPDIRRGLFALLIATAVGACSTQPPRQSAAATASPTTPAATAATASPTTPAASASTDAPIPNTPSPFDGLPEAVRATLDKPFTGDFKEMLKRRSIRVGVTFNRTHYFIDAGQ